MSEARAGCGEAAGVGGEVALFVGADTARGRSLKPYEITRGGAANRLLSPCACLGLAL